MRENAFWKGGERKAAVIYWPRWPAAPAMATEGAIMSISGQLNKWPDNGPEDVDIVPYTLFALFAREPNMPHWDDQPH